MIFARKRQVLFMAALALLLTLTAMPLAAQTICDSHAGRLADLHTREQVKQFVQCAAQHIETVGWQQAAQDFESVDWWEHPLYLFATRADGRVLLSTGVDIAPGAEVWDLQDADGLYLAREQVRVSRDFGGGYVYLRFENPETGRVEPALTWVQPIEHEGDLAYVGAALYLQDARGSCPPDTVRASLVYSERDVEAFVACAEHHLQQHGLRALHDFNTDPRWVSGPTYLILGDLQTQYQIVNPGQPHLVGTDTSTLVDADGVNIGIQTQRILGSHDDAYVYYAFRNPATDEIGYKATYVRRVLLDGRVYFLAAGLYVPSPECRNLPLAREVDTRDELEQYVRCAAQLVAERGELAWDLFLYHPQWIGGAAYIFVLNDECHQLVYPLDYQRQENVGPQCHVTDAEGFPVGVEVRAITRGEVGEGWVEYVWLNPASDAVETKRAFVIGGTLAGEPISIGAGLYETDMQQDG